MSNQLCGTTMSAQLGAILKQFATDTFLEVCSVDEKASRLSYEQLGLIAKYLYSVHIFPLLQRQVMLTSKKEPMIVLRITELHHLAVLEATLLLFGVAFVPLSPQDPPQRVEVLLEYIAAGGCAAVAVLTDQWATEVLDPLGVTFPLASKCQLRDEQQVPRTSIDEENVVKELPMCSDDDISHLIFTSGTTGGTPKAVICERGNLKEYVTGFSVTLGVAGQWNRILMLSSSTFDPSIGDIAFALLRGSTLIAYPKHEIHGGSSLGLILKQSLPSITVTTPALWSCVLCANTESLSQLKVCLGGEPMPHLIREKWASAVQLYNIYGTTEGTVYQFLKRVGPNDSHHQSIGQPFSNVLYDIVNDDGEATHSGELVISGPLIARGYYHPLSLNSPFSTNQRGRKEYRTGDAASRCAATGDVLLHGRLDFQVKINGKRTCLEDVQSSLCAMDRSHTIRNVFACCNSTLEVNNELVVIIHVVQNTASCDDEIDPPTSTFAAAVTLLAHRELPRNLIPPKIFVTRKPLPATTNGKLDRVALTKTTPSLLATFSLSSGNKESDAESCRQQSSRHYGACKAIWQEIFGVPVKFSTNFFLIGGESLIALKMVRKLYLAVNSGGETSIDKYGRMPEPYSPRHVAEHATLSDYADFLDRFDGTSCTNTSEREMVSLLQKSQCSSSSGSEELHPGSVANTPAVSLLIDALTFSSDLHHMPPLTVVQFLLENRLCTADGCEGSDTSSRLKARMPSTPPLLLAVSQGDENMVRLLLKHGARRTAVNGEGVTAGHIAIQQRNRALLALLLEHPEEHSALLPKNVRDRRMQSLLHAAARVGEVNLVQFLVETHGLEIDIRDCWQRTSLHWAILNEHVAVVEYFCSVLSKTAMSKFICEEDSTNKFVTTRKRIVPNTKNRRVRLAKKKTFLPYETPLELALRLYGPNNAMTKMLSSVRTLIYS